MNIVLATPPFSGGRKPLRSLPSLGLAYVARGVNNLSEVKVNILDCTAEGLSMDEAVTRILDFEPDMVGLSVHSGSIHRTQKLITAIKAERPNVISIVGGYHATAYDNLLLKDIPQIDMAMRGEADFSFPLLCERLLRSKSVEGVPGLSYRSNGRIIRGQPQIVEDLDSIPFPNRKLMESPSYWTGALGIEIPRILHAATIVSSRGCPHQCTFCSKLNPEFDRYRLRTAENVFQEIQYLHKSGYNLVAFVDENFSHNVKRLKRLCHLILDHNLKMRFIFQGTLYNLDDATLKLMHSAGFDGAAVGIESGSDRQLRRYKKPSNSRNLANGIRRAKKAHMFVYTTFICGAPGETREDHQETCRFVQDVRPHFCSIGGLYVFVQSSIGKDLLGQSPPQNLEASRSQDIHNFPGQLDKKEIDARIDEFQKAFAKSYRNWRRIPEFFDLVFHNPTVRIFLRRLLGNPKFLRQLFRGAPER